MRFWHCEGSAFDYVIRNIIGPGDLPLVSYEIVVDFSSKPGVDLCGFEILFCLILYHFVYVKGIYVLRTYMYMGDLWCRYKWVFVCGMLFVGCDKFPWLCQWAW